MSKVIPMMGVARIWIQAVAYSDHGNNGIRNQVIPGARILWMVTIKFSPVRMEAKPNTNAAVRAITTFEDASAL